MDRWRPNVTVAAVVANGPQFLMVEERDSATGKEVLNQPAGHLEPGESLIQAVAREVLEETRWEVSVVGYLGVALFTGGDGITYLRHSFLCHPVREHGDRELDGAIIAAPWMTYEQIKSRAAVHRSHLVLEVLRQYRAGLSAPLSLVTDP